MSLFDPPSPYLDNSVWNENQTLRPEVEAFIKSLLSIAYPLDKVYELAIIGSITTHQYSSNSDIDINVIGRKGESYDMWHKAFKNLNARTNLLPGTQHPVNFFFQEYHPSEPDAFTNSLGAYNVFAKKWLKHPVPYDELQDPEDRYYEEIQYAKLLLSMIESVVDNIYRDIVSNRIPEAMCKKEDLKLIFKQVDENRKLGYQYGMGTPSYNEYNILYKLLEDSPFYKLFHILIDEE
jgi:hypothetical protein